MKKIFLILGLFFVIVLAEAFEYDLGIVSITNIGYGYQDDSAVFTVTVKNFGSNPNGLFYLQLIKDQDIIEDLAFTEIIDPNVEKVIPLVWIIPEETTIGQYDIFAQIIYDSDENTINDISEISQIEILPFGIGEVTVGFPEHETNLYPFNFSFENNFSESIYYQAELGFQGDIYAISYYNQFQTSQMDKHIKLWISSNNTNNLSGGWINPGSMSSVFDGNMDFPQGANQILIVLDTPFSYNSANIIVATNRVYDTNVDEIHSFKFKETLSSSFNNRTRVANSHNQINPNSPPNNSYLFSRMPVTTFHYELTNIGALSGNVRDENGISIPTASVSIENSKETASINFGYFFIGNLPSGTYNVTASKTGYISSTQEVDIFTDQETSISYNLVSYPTISINGHLIKNDEPSVGVPEVTVFIDGYEAHSTITDGNGDFVFSDNIYANNSYTMEISYPGFETYSAELETTESDIDLGNVTIFEELYPPANLLAEQDENSTQVQLNWDAPQAKDLVSYKVYRFPQEILEFPDNWTFVASEITETNYLDLEWHSVTPGWYIFAVTAIYADNRESDPAISEEIEKIITIGSGDDELNTGNVLRVYPNPLKKQNPIKEWKAEISYNLKDKPRNGSIMIFNVKGQKIKEMEIGTSTSGAVQWNYKMESNGIYLIQLKSDNISAFGKCVIVK